jgi:fibro-slime domain-containing protein
LEVFIMRLRSLASSSLARLVGASALLATTQCGDPEFVTTTGTGAGDQGGGSSVGGGSGTGAGFAQGGGSSVGGSTSGTGGAPPEPFCGDGIKGANEACDDGNAQSGDGCAGDCGAVEQGFACLVPGQMCTSTVVCGDGVIGGLETCDDGGTPPAGGDGCSDMCQLEAGWVCPDPGVACEAALCGDGIVAGQEDCEDGDMPPSSGDGCSDACRLEPGFKCDVPGQACVPTVCGDGVTEGSEQCDDGNNDFGDLCTPLYCTIEPDCSLSPGMACTTSCGDGIKLPNGTEECEDGNTAPGDGCSPTCTVEPGYVCNPSTSDPNQLVLPVVLRDFKIAHPDFEGALGNDLGIVTGLLGMDGKPVYAGNPTTPTTTGQANFDQWYRDVSGTNFTILQTLTLAKLMTGEFQYNNGNFFPIDGQGFGNEGNAHNFHFTSEVRYWFEYKGTEVLSFTGDDDVWVYVNKHLAVNLGGVHGAQSGSVNLAAQAAALELVVGNVYEIVVFQAERHTTQSNYRLTLSNFVNGKSSCTSVCGDGIKTPDEACDDGVNDGTYGHCTMDCKRGPRCGDGTIDAGFEECDDGQNVTPYEGCAPGCKLGASCGDGNVDSLFGEECDDGVNDGGYGECGIDCTFGERCGDGVVQAANGEECDDGNSNNGDTCKNNCQSNVAQ